MLNKIYNFKEKIQSFKDCQNNVFCKALSDLFSHKKEGHLGLYHYGEPAFEGDPVIGGSLWDKFVKNSENYYQFRFENALVPTVADYMADLMGSTPVSIIDLGPGSDTSLQAKTFPFLLSLDRIDSYIPVDISIEYLKEINEAVTSKFALLSTSLQQKNYFTDTINFNVNSTPVFLFLSSNISNLPEINKHGAYEKNLLQILTHFHKLMHRPGYLIVSQDYNNNEESLIKAYSDPIHVQFSLNILQRMKRDALAHEANFNPLTWMYRPEWFPERSLLAHTLYATSDQHFMLAGKGFAVKRGDKFVVDNSHKYNTSDFMAVCAKAGFSSVKTFLDQSDRIAIHVLKRD